jgi:hypothetical protein
LTERSVPAFRSVTPEDYNGGNTLRRRTEHFASVPYPPPPPYYWGYRPWGYYPWGYYPGPVFFGFYGFGHRGFRH